MVRALGRQPHLRHRGRAARAGRRRRRARRRRACAAPCAGSSATRTRTAAGARTRAATSTAWVGRGPSTASQTAWALIALHAAGERSPARRARVRLADRAPSAPTAPGTSRSSPAPASRRLLHQLPPVPADVPDHGARACLSAAGDEQPTTAAARRDPARFRPTATVMAARPGRTSPVASRALPRRGPRRPARALRLRAHGRPDRRRRARRPAGRARLARSRSRPRLGGRADHPVLVRLAATLSDARSARAVRAADRGQPRRPARRTTPPGSSCAGTARCRPTPSASWCCTSSAPPRPQRIELSDKICTALQLTEHCQDVAEDLRTRADVPAGRDARASAARRRPRLRSRRASLRDLVAVEVARARELLARARR